jgi:hypothetical protein
LIDIIQFWLYENISDENADKLDQDLSEPPANVSPALLAEDPMWSAEAEMAMFNQLSGKLPG